MNWDYFFGRAGQHRGEPLESAGKPYAKRTRKKVLNIRARRSERLDKQARAKPSFVRRILPCQRY
jgi:hypothetical protein